MKPLLWAIPLLVMSLMLKAYGEEQPKSSTTYPAVEQFGLGLDNLFHEEGEWKCAHSDGLCEDWAFALNDAHYTRKHQDEVLPVDISTDTTCGYEGNPCAVPSDIPTQSDYDRDNAILNSTDTTP